MVPRRGLTRIEILDEALALADELGLEAVTMRLLAHRLNVTPMALYRHVGDKDGLLDGMVERLLGGHGEQPHGEHVAGAGGTDAGQHPEGQHLEGQHLEGGDPRSADDWRIVLRRQADALRRTARRHPAAFSLLLARRAGTAEALRARDDVLRALGAAGVPADRVPAVERLLSTFVIGFAASEASGRFADRERADADFRYAEALLARLLGTGAW
ncbi:MAG TPA: TetR family transcriptional regulator [Kineosporiaceae bacterium]|nr:TetR family transcriptional regulator [Kineosporiaceae bacterium]